ncbi:MAG: SpoIIE family protein phosphatase [Proteobacteria bacterium]|nr:SpoIIE family protein phosphatase [Pseudomonadota bacterium]
MENSLPKHVNDRRRGTLTKYTVLALLVYHILFIAAYLAIVFEVGQYKFIDISYVYSGVLLTNFIILAIIRIKNQITIPFIKTMLYTQIMASIFYITWMFFVMDDLRYLTLIASLLALIFVFIQSPLIISYISIIVLAAMYLIVSYVSSRFIGQHENFAKEALVIIVFIPVSSFLGYMCGLLQKQQRELKQSKNKINDTYQELESFNQRMMESLHYAEMIQRSLLPGIDRMKTESPESLIIWMPKDIVGGDIFYTCTYPGKTIVVLMDCTGHGVPGAFLTLIAYTEVRKIILDEKCYDPSTILKRLNRAMKKVLHKHSKKETNDGLDAAVIDVDHDKCSIRYAGANIPVFIVGKDGTTIIKGDKHSIGYLNSDVNFPFKNSTMALRKGDCVYLKSDGYTDQLGGEKRLRFGTRRFQQLIENMHHSPFSFQRKELLQRLINYKDSNEQIDDITVIGFRM